MQWRQPLALLGSTGPTSAALHPLGVWLAAPLIGVGRTHKETHVLLLVQDLEVRIVHAITGELLRELTINPDKELPTMKPQMRNSRTYVPQVRLSRIS